jgi:lysophospholipase L1-like esterase
MCEKLIKQKEEIPMSYNENLATQAFVNESIEKLIKPINNPDEALETGIYSVNNDEGLGCDSHYILIVQNIEDTINVRQTKLTSDGMTYSREVDAFALDSIPEFEQVTVSQSELNEYKIELDARFEQIEEQISGEVPDGDGDSEIDNLFEYQYGKNILIPDSENGYYDGTTPKASTNHIRTPNPIPLESGHTILTLTTDLTEGNTSHLVCITFLDETGSKISSPSKSTQHIVDYNDGTVAMEIPSNATAFLVWLSGVKTSGATFENFSLQYDNFKEATFVPYVPPSKTIAKSHLPYGVQTLYGKTIVNFGDSIFGNYRPPNDISTEIAKLTGATVHNCGFGGCRMAINSSQSQFDAFSMYRLADSVANNDWSLQDNAVNTTDWGMPAYFPDTLALLKSIDFSMVDIITIAYGTNDFTGNVELENLEDNKDTKTFTGALRYSIETLLNAYPHLKIFVCSQAYRFWLDDNGEFSDDSDTRTNTREAKLTDFVEKTKEVAEEYHLPYVNNYYSLGFNKFNRSIYFPATDGTHPSITGRILMAAHIAKHLF